MPGVVFPDTDLEIQARTTPSGSREALPLVCCRAGQPANIRITAAMDVNDGGGEREEEGDRYGRIEGQSVSVSKNF